MKFKKLLATVLVAICAFMLVGCGQMTAKESVESAVTNSASITDSANIIANGGNSDSMASGLSVKVLPYASMNEYLEKVQQVTEDMAAFAEDIVEFGVEVAELTAHADDFLADYAVLEEIITDEDVATLSKNANVLKNVEKELKNIANEFVKKAENIASKMENIEDIMNMNFDEIINFANWSIEQISKAVSKLSDVTTALSSINDIIAKYVIE